MKYPSHAELIELSPEERLRLIQDVWETFEVDPASLVLSQDYKREIDLRVEEWRRSGSPGTTWQEVKDRITREK